MSQLTEYQLVRPGGTVLVSTIAAEGCGPAWDPPPGMGISGRCYGRMRTLPDGPWKVIACYPEGYWTDAFYDEDTGQLVALAAPVLWDMTGEGSFQPFNPADPAEPRSEEVRQLSGTRSSTAPP